MDIVPEGAPGTAPPDDAPPSRCRSTGAPVPGRAAPFRPRAFRPPWWLRNPHAQTLGGILLRPAGRHPLERRRLDTPDGDFLDLDLTADPGPDAPVALLLHGLEGHIRRRYATGVLSRLFDRGVRGAGLNFRGCGGEVNRAARFYHAGETGDLSFVVEHLRDRHPGRAIGAIGFSLGGSVLLKYLGERGADSLIDAAATICVPFDLAASCDRVGRGFMGGLYTAYFLRSLRRKVRAKQAVLDGVVDTGPALHARTLREFDDALTAPLHGFADAADYYAKADARPFLPRIRVPTLLIQSRDDPISSPDAISDEQVARNPYLVAAFAPGGGHVGFVEGEAPWRASFHADGEAVRFLAHHLSPKTPATANDDPVPRPEPMTPDACTAFSHRNR